MSGLAEQGKIKLDAKTAKCIRGIAGKSIKLSADVYEKYFACVKSEDVAGIVEEALAAWFGKGGEADVRCAGKKVLKYPYFYSSLLVVHFS